MLRARRLARAAAVCVLAVTALSACRSAPDVAAYVGAGTITEDRVDALYDDAAAKLAATAGRVAGAQGGDPSAAAAAKPSFSRRDLVSILVGLDVTRALARERSLTATPLPAAQVAQSVNLPPDAAFVPLYAEYRGLLDAVVKQATPVQPTDADLRDVFRRLSDAGAVPPGTPFEQFRGSISPQDQQTLRQNIAVRNQLQAAADKLRIAVNPRYGTPELGLVTTQGQSGQPVSLVVVRFADPARSAPVVTDAAAG